MLSSLDINLTFKSNMYDLKHELKNNSNTVYPLTNAGSKRSAASFTIRLE